MRSIRATVAAGAFALAGLALAGCGADIGLDSSTEHAKRDFTMSGATLTLVTDQDVSIVPGSAGTVRTDRWLTGKARKDARWSLSGGTLTLSSTCTGVTINCESRYEVAVPKGVRLRVSADADVEVRDLTATVAVSSAHGDVKATRLSGPFQATSAYGEIDGVDLSSADVLAKADTGDVRLGFRVAPDRASATSKYGDVSLAVPKRQFHVVIRSKYGDARSALADDRDSERTLTAVSESGDAVVSASA